MDYKSDVAIAKQLLADMPSEWDGKTCVLEMKAQDYNWRQMEWWAFYFELLCRNRLQPQFRIPGDTVSFVRPSGRKTVVTFDASRSISWDFKAKAIKSDDHKVILNDKKAMDLSLAEHQYHGLIVALCDVEYNDKDRSFQRWHDTLKGGKSRYVREREERTSISRYRKTRAALAEILFLVISADTAPNLDLMKQGRNSDGTARPPKYMLNLEGIGDFLVDAMSFG